MRLRELIRRARAAFDGLAGLKGEEAQMPGGGRGYSVTGLVAFRESVGALLELPLAHAITADLKHLEATAAFRERADAMQMDTADWSTVKTLTVRTRDTLSALIDTIKLALGPEEEHTVAIRLPDPTKGGLDALRDTLNIFSTCLEQPVRRLIHGSVRVVGVDRGSAWIDIITNTPAALALISQLVEAWQNYLKRKAEIRALEAKARALEAEADVAEAIARGRMSMLQKWLDRESERIVSESASEPVDGKPAPEHVAVVKTSIRKGARLLERGAAIEVRVLDPGNPDQRRTGLLEAPPEILQLGPGGAEDEGEDSGPDDKP